MYGVLTYAPLVGADYKVIGDDHTVLLLVFSDESDHSGRLYACEVCGGHMDRFVLRSELGPCLTVFKPLEHVGVMLTISCFEAGWDGACSISCLWGYGM